MRCAHAGDSDCADFYVGYLVRYHAGAEWAGGNNTFTLHLCTNSSSTTTLNFGLRGNPTAGSDEFVIRYGTGSPVAGTSTGGQVVTGTDYYLVLKVSSAAGVFSSANMWLNPSADDEATTPGGAAALTFTAFANPITHIFWREAAFDSDDVLRGRL